MVKDADVTGRGITANGDLAPTAAKAARDLAVAEAFGFLPVSLLLLVAVVGLIQVAGLLAATREREQSLMLARGSSTRQLLVAGLVEALVVALLGGIVGTALATLVVRLTSGAWSYTPVVLSGGVASLGIALACLAGVSINSTLRLARGGQPRSDRVKAVAGAAALVLVSAAAALATWQLRRSGSFIVTDDEGASRTDLLPALSPAILLAAAAVVGLVVLAPVTRLVEALTKRAATGVWLAAAQLARGLVVQAVPVVLTILATGTATFAALYAGTATTLNRDISALSAGAPIRATVTGAATLDGVPGITASVPVWLDPASKIGNLTLTTLAAPMSTFGEVAMLPSSDALPTDQLVPAPAADAVVIGQGTVTLELRGHITLDPWQSLELTHQPQLARALADKVPEGVRDLHYEGSITSTYQEMAEPDPITVQLFVRDPATGRGEWVTGTSINVPGLEITHDGDFTNPRWTAPEGSASATLDLPPGSVIEGLQLTSNGFTSVNRTTELELSLLADGTPLLGATTADWLGSKTIPKGRMGAYDEAVAKAGEPSVSMGTETVNHNGVDEQWPTIVSNRPFGPIPVLDASTPTWQLSLPQYYSGDPLTIGRGVAVTPNYDPLGVMADVQDPVRPPVPVALTPAAVNGTSLAVGDSFELTLFGEPVPATVAAITDAIPGITSPVGALVDSTAWAQALPLKSIPNPSEFWGATDNPQEARAEAAKVSGITSVTAASAATPSAPAAQAFWVAAGSALALAITGLAAAAATQLAHRRPEVAVLRALGMTPSAQGASRAWEIGGALALATAAGIGSGWLVGWLVVDPVVRSSTPSDFPARLTLDAGPWLVLLAVGALAIGAILAALARAVRAQALDAEYREEVR